MFPCPIQKILKTCYLCSFDIKMSSHLNKKCKRMSRQKKFRFVADFFFHLHQRLKDIVALKIFAGFPIVVNQFSEKFISFCRNETVAWKRKGMQMKFEFFFSFDVNLRKGDDFHDPRWQHLCNVKLDASPKRWFEHHFPSFHEFGFISVAERSGVNTEYTFYHILRCELNR